MVSFKLGMRPAAAGRERLEARDREQPSRNGGTAFKAASLLPHVEEHVAQKVLGHGLVADEPEQPAINVGAMAGEQHLHGELVARCDALNQNFIGRISPAVAAIAGTAAAADPGRTYD